MSATEVPTVRYRAPKDAVAAPCRLHEILTAIHARDADYWSAGAGVGALYARRGDTLTIAFKPEFGYFLSAYRGADPASQVASTNADYDTVVPLTVGDRTVSVPRAFFVAPLRAIQIVEQFARDGGRSKVANWITLPGRPRGS